MRNFEKFFDIIDNYTFVHMHIKKNFKIFHFLAKFLNLLEGPPIEFFLNRFFSTTMHSQTKFQIVSGWVLTFGLDPLPRELCTGRRRNMRRPESYYFPYHVFGDNSEESLNDKNSFKVSSWREHFGRQWSSSTGYHNTIKPLLPSYRYKTELAFGLLTYHQMAPPKVTRCFLLGYQECKVN